MKNQRFSRGFDSPSRRGKGKPQQKSPAQDVHLVFGVHPVEECLAIGSVRQLLVSSRAPAHLLNIAHTANIDIQRVTTAELDTLSGGGVHQGVVAFVDGFSYVEIADLFEIPKNFPLPVLVFLDRITDPHNLGAVARSSFLLGARGMVIPLHDSAHVTAGAMKASAGALAHFPVARVPNLKNSLLQAREKGWFVIGTAGNAPTELFHVDLRRPLALVVGSEHYGLRPGVASACDVLARLPMTQTAVGSYNASVAAALCLYECFRQNRS